MAMGNFGVYSEFLMLRDNSMHKNYMQNVNFSCQHIRTKANIKAESLVKFSLMKFNEAAERHGMAKISADQIRLYVNDTNGKRWWLE